MHGVLCEFVIRIHAQDEQVRAKGSLLWVMVLRSQPHCSEACEEAAQHGRRVDKISDLRAGMHQGKAWSHYLLSGYDSGQQKDLLVGATCEPSHHLVIPLIWWLVFNTQAFQIIVGAKKRDQDVSIRICSSDSGKFYFCFACLFVFCFTAYVCICVYLCIWDYMCVGMGTGAMTHLEFRGWFMESVFSFHT